MATDWATQDFWETANLDALLAEIEMANRARDKAYKKLREAEEKAAKAHAFARLIEERVNYWKKRRNL